MTTNTGTRANVGSTDRHDSIEDRAVQCD